MEAKLSQDVIWPFGLTNNTNNEHIAIETRHVKKDHACSVVVERLQ
jgi:hypothetical protein